ncbi:MAG TPA: hypothetical protein VNB90_03370 [Cytophagaceae bacterium]|jgi:hypothetical protein|nr:hypothetical protein [Cytophagaceae bacterium]
MKPSLLLLALIFVISSNTFSQVRKKQEIQNNPADISEYFLLIPSETHWALPGDDQDPFTGRQRYFKPDPHCKVTIDKKNAYIHIWFDTELESTFTMCYFVKADKTKVLAVHYYQAGGDCDSYLIKFYTYSPDTKKFTDVTKEVFPTLTLKDLKPTQQIPVDFVYTLPQYGTIINAKADNICEQDTYGRITESFMDYFQKYQKLPYKNIQLKWNKEKGVFEKGEVK